MTCAVRSGFGESSGERPADYIHEGTSTKDEHARPHLLTCRAREHSQKPGMQSQTIEAGE